MDLTLAPEDLAALEANPYWDVMYPARVEIDGRAARGVARFRGPRRGRARRRAGASISTRATRSRGDRFALLAEYDDAAKLVERLAVDLYRASASPSRMHGS